jgi:hypothetical protein
MDFMATRNPPLLFEAALAEGLALGLKLKQIQVAPHRFELEPDAWVRLAMGETTIELPVLVRRDVTPETLGAIAHRMAQWGGKALLIAGYVPPAMADALRAMGTAFLDGAGNAFIDVAPLFIWVKGQRKRVPAEAQEPLGRAFQPRGLQVLFALLCNPGLVDRPYREIAAHAQVAHGTVGWVMAELPQLGFMGGMKGHRRLVQGERLLAQWVEAYARTLRPKLLLGRYAAEKLDWAQGAEVEPYGLLLGGEPAGERLTGYLKPATATFYGEQVDPRFLAAHRLRKDPAGRVEFRRRFWAFEAEEPHLVPTILVYADLLAIGDGRCLETAALLLERIHARLVRPA